MNTIKEDDNFIKFLKERIDKASSTETQAAYTIVLEEYTKKILYTEEEVKQLFIDRAKEFSPASKVFGDFLLKQDLNWFEQNKKK